MIHPDGPSDGAANGTLPEAETVVAAEQEDQKLCVMNVADEDSQSLQSLGNRPIGPFKTVPHFTTALLGLASAIFFSVALVQTKPFDASVAGVLMLTCWRVFKLLSERRHLAQQVVDMKSSVQCRETPSGAPSQTTDAGTPRIARQDTSSRTRAATVPTEAAHTDELDLTGFAQSLSVSIAGANSMQTDTLSKVLMTALAKEHLRCVSALRWYKAQYGPLEEDDVATSSSGMALLENVKLQDRGMHSTQGAECLAVEAVPLAQQKEPKPEAASAQITRDPLESSMRSLSLDISRRSNFAAELLGSSAIPRTPRSPRGPPSPITQCFTISSASGKEKDLGEPVEMREPSLPPARLHEASAALGTSDQEARTSDSGPPSMKDIAEPQEQPREQAEPPEPPKSSLGTFGD